MAAVPPLIGVSTYLEADTRWGVWRLEAALLPAAYPRLVQRAGGLAVLLPPDAPERAARTVARLDGLVIAGGPDVEPLRRQQPGDAQGAAVEDREDVHRQRDAPDEEGAPTSDVVQLLGLTRRHRRSQARAAACLAAVVSGLGLVVHRCQEPVAA